MRTLKTILSIAVLLVAITSCTAESLDEDETLVNNTEILATGGEIDHTSTPED
ncbi:hypothetical protein [Lacinutrix jangbogonensis]|uniref:hypothetical protein n=1 Tax=Lacinutrix jangbogonensis TaxID=1469557 RepID=UPI000B0D6F54|nr:hypothetical protein [Lacinutrix jangbogonensis]